MTRRKRTALMAALPVAFVSACGASSAAQSRSAHGTTATSARGNVDVVAGESGGLRRRLARLVARAKATYANEIKGPLVHTDLRLLAGDQALLNDLARGDRVAAQAEAEQEMRSNPTQHITRVSVVRGSHVLINAVRNHNGSFVVAPLQQRLSWHGRELGTLLVSVQDVVGYVKLIRVYTGAWAVVRGSSGQVRASLPAAAQAPLPRSGLQTIAGHRYGVSSFTVGGWPKETLTVWVLAPA